MEHRTLYICLTDITCATIPSAGATHYIPLFNYLPLISFRRGRQQLWNSEWVNAIHVHGIPLGSRSAFAPGTNLKDVVGLLLSQTKQIAFACWNLMRGTKIGSNSRLHARYKQFRSLDLFCLRPVFESKQEKEIITSALIHLSVEGTMSQTVVLNRQKSPPLGMGKFL